MQSLPTLQITCDEITSSSHNNSFIYCKKCNLVFCLLCGMSHLFRNKFTHEQPDMPMLTDYIKEKHSDIWIKISEISSLISNENDEPGKRKIDNFSFIKFQKHKSILEELVNNWYLSLDKMKTQITSYYISVESLFRKWLKIPKTDPSDLIQLSKELSEIEQDLKDKITNDFIKGQLQTSLENADNVFSKKSNSSKVFNEIKEVEMLDKIDEKLFKNIDTHKLNIISEELEGVTSNIKEAHINISKSWDEFDTQTDWKKEENVEDEVKVQAEKNDAKKESSFKFVPEENNWWLNQWNNDFESNNNCVQQTTSKVKGEKIINDDNNDIVMELTRESNSNDYRFKYKNILFLTPRVNSTFSTFLLIYSSKRKTINKIPTEQIRFEDDSQFYSLKGCKSVNIGNSLIITGGNENGSFSSSAYLIRLIDEEKPLLQVKTLPNMHSARECHNMIFIPNLSMIFIAAGQNLTKCEKLTIENDNISNDWETVASLNHPRANATMFSVNTHFIYLIGGFNHSNKTYIPDYEVLNLNRLDEGWKLYQIENKFAISTMGVLRWADDKIMLIGGFGGGSHYLNNRMILGFKEDNKIKIEKEDENFMEKGWIFYSNQEFCQVGDDYCNFDFKNHLYFYDDKKDKLCKNKQI